jgi:hypothetical protein
LPTPKTQKSVGAVEERHVRGAFFADYVRMLRRKRDVDWSKVLPPEDLVYLVERIEKDGWYPMATFERLGLTILDHVEGATLDAVHLWGRYSVHEFVRGHPELIARNEPVESLMRLKVLRATMFDFPAFDIPTITVGHARVVIDYRMSPRAEESACVQTVGFCEGVLSLAGANEVQSAFEERSYRGDARTCAALDWITPGSS